MTYLARGILFDLDGTLVDSMPDIAEAANLMLEALELESRSFEQLSSWVGNGSPALVKRALTGKTDGEPPQPLFERALRLYLDLYAENVFQQSYLYDGVTQTLEHFRESGFKMACVTNKPMRHTELLLQESKLGQFFSCVVGGDTLKSRKPDPEPLFYAADKLQLDPSACVMVGDSPSDVRAAQAAAIPVLCLTYGYNQGQDLSSLAANALVDRFDHLATLIQPQV